MAYVIQKDATSVTHIAHNAAMIFSSSESLLTDAD